jgi:histo-blood group ABO system transferase
MNIGLLVIATNKYITFLDPLVESINKYFLINHNVTIFCFTNIVDHKSADNVKIVEQEHMPWPLPTLKRYEIFYKNRELFNNMDCLYYLDVDMIINDYIGDEFLPDDKELVCVVHPGYRRDLLQSFERRTSSSAYVNYNHYVYHCGGVQGGKKDAYLKICEKLSNNILNDMNIGIIAVWHDESHWNSYLINNPNSYKELDCDYCYPQSPPDQPNSWILPNKKIILALHKNHAEMRS